MVDKSEKNLSTFFFLSKKFGKDLRSVSFEALHLVLKMMNETMYKITGNPISACKGLLRLIKAEPPVTVMINNAEYRIDTMLDLLPNGIVAQNQYVFKCTGFYEGHLVAAAIDSVSSLLYLSAEEDISDRIAISLGIRKKESYTF